MLHSATMRGDSEQSQHETQTRANEARALSAEAEASERVDAAPLKITFEFTGDCNLHCFFCDCEFGRNEFRKQGFHRFAMEEGLFRAMAETAFPHATVVNPTVIGEPFTFPHFDLLLDYAEKYAVKLELVTNGMLLKGARMERVLPLLDRLIMSFDGGTKETFEHCRTGSRFEVVIDNLRQFSRRRRELGLERRAKFTFGVTLMRENIEELPRIVEWAHELDVDEVSAGHLLVFTRELRSSSLFEHKALANRCILAARERAAELGVRLTAPALFDLEVADDDPLPLDQRTQGLDPEKGATGMTPRQEHATGAVVSDTRPRQLETLAHESPPPAWVGSGRYWCQFAWRQVFINISGDVAPCCHQNRPVVGNVFRQDWDEIWNGEEYRALRRGLHDGQPRPYCASCSLLAEQGLVDYREEGYIFEDKFPEQSRADLRPDGKPRR
ncbi:MAG: SPASM domain-containing protein [Planctomycetes bacterium]|nr:SPASM domain-containing protein [Planctomycetota bacterium]